MIDRFGSGAYERSMIFSRRRRVGKTVWLSLTELAELPAVALVSVEGRNYVQIEVSRRWDSNP
jgi:hypothetical protein